MTENEKRLRVWLANNGGAALAWLPATFDAVLDEQRASARAEALEEAANTADGGPLYVRGVLMQPSERIRALVGFTPPASIPVERVREVLRSVDAELVVISGVDGRSRLTVAETVLTELSRRLGVPLDTGQKAKTEIACLVCGSTGPHKMSCRSTERAAAVAKAPVTHRRSGAQWAACGANGPIIHLSSNPADVTCEDSRCKVTP